MRGEFAAKLGLEPNLCNRLGVPIGDPAKENARSPVGFSLEIASQDVSSLQRIVAEILANRIRFLSWLL